MNDTHMSDQAGGDRGDVARRSRARTAPRLGSFVTIAAALLLLFGAASRMGKVEETAALFGIDRQAEDRINQELDRLRAAVVLGAVPVSAAELKPPVGAVPVDTAALPPRREEVDIDAMRHAAAAERNRLPVSMMAQQDDRQQLRPPGEQVLAPVPVTAVHRSDPLTPISSPSVAAPADPHPDSYVVATGDTWVKIAKRTLGDANRWKDIQKLNPSAQSGLEVGMKLRIPK